MQDEQEAAVSTTVSQHQHWSSNLRSLFAGNVVREFHKVHEKQEVVSFVFHKSFESGIVLALSTLGPG